jgi:hypothetical protein
MLRLRPHPCYLLHQTLILLVLLPLALPYVENLFGHNTIHDFIRFKYNILFGLRWRLLTTFVNFVKSCKIDKSYLGEYGEGKKSHVVIVIACQFIALVSRLEKVLHADVPC